MYISVIMCIPLRYCINKSYALAANRLGEATSSLEIWNLLQLIQLRCPIVPISYWSYFRCSDLGAYLLLFESCSSTAATRRILSLDFWSVNYGPASKFQSWLLWGLLKKNMKHAGHTDAYCTCSFTFQKCIAKYHFRLLIFQPLEKIISFLVVLVQQNEDLQGMVIWDRGPRMS